MTTSARVPSRFDFQARIPSTARLAAALTVAVLAAVQPPPAAAQTAPACSGSSLQGDAVATQKVFTTDRGPDGNLEGPVWLNGALYFSDFSYEGNLGFPSRIHRLANGSTTVFDANSGSNGLAIDTNGYLYSANHKASGIVRHDPVSGIKTTIVGSYNGQPFNSPNDLAITPNGTIYFTDPDWQHDPLKPGQPGMGVYRRAPNGTVTLIDYMNKPNGVILSPSGDALYVGNADGVVRKYKIVGGVPQPGVDFITNLKYGPDGMAMDCLGTLYVTENGANVIYAFSSTRPSTPLTRLGSIRIDENITNAAFGDADRRTLYITGKRSVWKYQMSVQGAPY